MDVIADHNALLEKFFETQTELYKAEKIYRIIHPSIERKDSKFYIPRHLPRFNYSSEKSEESVFEEEFHRKEVNLKSIVVSRLRKPGSRKDAICKQNINQKVRTRNRRILGMLQSTLRKFQDEEVKRQPQDLKRKLLEQKVESVKEEEKKQMKREEAELCYKIKEKKLQLDCLKEMMKITELFQTWKSNKTKLLSFIITKAEPKICYLPVSHTSISKKRLEKSRAGIQEDILKHAAAVKEELVEIQDSYRIAYFPTVENSQEIKR